MAGQDEAGRSATVSYKSGDAPEHTQRCNWLRLALRIGTRQQTPPGKWGRRVEGRYIGFEKAGKSCQKLKKSERGYNVQKTYRPFEAVLFFQRNVEKQTVLLFWRPDGENF
jgi:hypothetical protein